MPALFVWVRGQTRIGSCLPIAQGRIEMHVLRVQMSSPKGCVIMLPLLSGIPPAPLRLENMFKPQVGNKGLTELSLSLEV